MGRGTDATTDVTTALERHLAATSPLSRRRLLGRSQARERVEAAERDVAFARAEAFLDHLHRVSRAQRLAVEQQRSEASDRRRRDGDAAESEVRRIFAGDAQEQQWALALVRQARLSQDDTALLLDVVERFRPFEQAWRQHDRDRRRSRLIHSLIAAGTGLVVGVVMVEVVADRLGDVSPAAGWGFAVLAWIVLDYWLEPLQKTWRIGARRRHIARTLTFARTAVYDLRRARGLEDGVWLEGWP